ncbi:Major facilitator superfamily domain, general substrate transporter [Metarhizium rileyi]|uniref:Major facilitator superfamily domain, general substrate transporter n=1 Tax=Metarhizium rileyi (strain RCEF 4871) TaxID=1649241 RepID=A0A167KNI2_METRR|nr:Major facilitator superfamily domain, general substrate transporter [Metarhizium rileyi RCEF 4871]
MDSPQAIDVEKRACILQEVHAVDNVGICPSRSSVTSSPVVHSPHCPTPRFSPDTDASVEDEHVPPDGGWRAWSQVLATHLINAMSWGYAASFGVYQLYYVDTLGLPSAQVSWVGSCQVFLTFGACAFSGRLADAGYARQTVIAGCCFAVLGAYTTSFCSEYWQIFLAQGVCTGIGLGIIFAPAISVASSYFNKNRSLALSVAATGTSLGGLVFPSTVQYLIPRVGFRWAARSAALVSLAICAGACALLRPCIPGRKTGSLIEWAAFKEPPYSLFAAASFLNFYGIYFGQFYINSFARNIMGFSSLESVNLLLLSNAVGIPVRPIVGLLANDYLGPINVFIMATASVGIMLFAWTGITTRTSMYIFSAFFGVAVSSNQGTFVPSLASLTKDPQKMGTRFGMVETLCSFATLAGPPTAGALIDRSGGQYVSAQIWGGSIMIAAALTVVASRIAATGWKWKVMI